MLNAIQPIKWKKNLQTIGFLMISIGALIVLFSSIDFSFLEYYGEEKQTEETIYHLSQAIEPDSVLNNRKIRRVQILLNHSGFLFYPKVLVNAKYDNATEKAIKKIQKDKEMPQTGIVDSKVYKILEEYAGLKKENNFSSLNYNGTWNVVYKENDGSVTSKIFRIIQKQNEAYITGKIPASNDSDEATFYGSVDDEAKKIVLMSTSNTDYICFFIGETKEGFIEGTYECSSSSGEWVMVKN